MASYSAHNPHEMTPVFSPEALWVHDGLGFREALDRLAKGGDLKATLLLVALTHFASRGYDGVQVREVAEEAGVSKPTLYYHFGSKEGLFRQLCLVAHSVLEHRMEAVVAQVLTDELKGAEAIEAAAFRIARGYVDLLMETPEFTGFVLRSIAVPSPDSGFRDLMPLVERTIAPVGRFIHQAYGIGFEQARKEMMIFTGIFGALMEERIRHPEYAIDDAELRWAVRRWLRGLQG